MTDLKPSVSWLAGPDNYCYWEGDEKSRPPENTGLVVRDKYDFWLMLSLEEDVPVRITVGENSADMIHPLAVIGGDGFSFVAGNRMPHLGHVMIGDNVEIGAYSTVDRAVLQDTYIGDNVKIDHHVHVGHNAWIGRNTTITAGAIIGGSAEIGNDCWIGLGAIIRNKVVVGPNVTVGMGAVVISDVPDGATVVGNPARKLS